MKNKKLELADLLFIPEKAFQPIDSTTTTKYSISAFPDDKSKNEIYKENIRNCEFGGTGKKKRNKYIIENWGTTSETNDDIQEASDLCINTSLKELSEDEGAGACVFLSPLTKCETFTDETTCTKGKDGINDSNSNYCEWFRYNGKFPTGNIKGNDTDGYCFNSNSNQKNMMPMNDLLFDNVSDGIDLKNLKRDPKYQQNLDKTKENLTKYKETLDKIKPDEDNRPEISGRCLYLDESNLDKLKSGKERTHSAISDVNNDLLKKRQIDCNTKEGCNAPICGENFCKGDSIFDPLFKLFKSESDNSEGLTNPSNLSINDFKENKSYYNSVTWNEKRPFSTDHGWEVITDFIDYGIFGIWERGWNPDIYKGKDTNNLVNKDYKKINKRLYSGRCLDYDEIFSMICEYDENIHNCKAFINSESTDESWKSWPPINYPEYSKNHQNARFMFRKGNLYYDYRSEIKNAFDSYSIKDISDYDTFKDYLKTKEITLNPSDPDPTKTYIENIINSINSETKLDEKSKYTKAFQNVIKSMRFNCGNKGKQSGIGYPNASFSDSDIDMNTKEIKAPPLRQSKSMFILSTFILIGAFLLIHGLKIFLYVTLGETLKLSAFGNILYGTLTIILIYIFVQWIRINIQPAILEDTIKYFDSFFYKDPDSQKIPIFYIIISLIFLFSTTIYYYKYNNSNTPSSNATSSNATSLNSPS